VNKPYRWTKPHGHWDLTSPSAAERFAFVSVGDLLAAGDRPPAADGDHWGPWVYRQQTAELSYADRYSIDLERCRTSAQVLDWVVQLRHKSWTTAADIGALVAALDDLLDLQATRCGWGVERSIVSRKQYAARSARAPVAVEGR
jgi:hypothetical protein